jgi:hypothetical protein
MLLRDQWIFRYDSQYGLELVQPLWSSENPRFYY